MFVSENIQNNHIIKEPEAEYNKNQSIEVRNNEIIIHIKLDNGFVISKKNNNNPIEKDLRF